MCGVPRVFIPARKRKKRKKRKFKSCHKHPGEEAKQRRYHSDWHVAASGQISV